MRSVSGRREFDVNITLRVQQVNVFGISFSQVASAGAAAQSLSPRHVSRRRHQRIGAAGEEHACGGHPGDVCVREDAVMNPRHYSCV